MASPQKEHGYTPIANELLEVLALYKFTVYQRAIIDVILRKTYGYGKKEDRISISQFVEATGIKKGHVWETLSGLKKVRVIVYSDSKKVSLNKDWEKWKVPCRRYKSTVPTVQKYRVQELQKKKEKRNKTNFSETEKSSPLKAKKKYMGKFRNYDENKHPDEPTIDADSGELVSKPGEGVQEKAAAKRLREKFVEMCVNKIGTAPVIGLAEKTMVKSALTKLTELQILDLFDEWFGLGKSDEDTAHMTRALSNNQITNYKVKNNIR